MTTDALFAVFADFNEPKDEPETPAVEEEAAQAVLIGQIREEAWTDGYLTGRQEPIDRPDDRMMTAKLLTSLHDLECQTADAVEAASLSVAVLLVNTMIAAASDDWPAKLLGRVQLVADRIKPAMTVAPEFALRDDRGIERQFSDIADLSRALEDGLVGEDVTVRWQRGEATISRTALLEDLRQAVIPLSAGLVNEQNAGYQS